MTIFWFDTETGGLNAGTNPILTLAGMVEVNGEIKEEFYFKMKPLPGQIINEQALAVNKITREEIQTFEDPHVVLNKLNMIMGKYSSRYNKMSPGGHNVDFDMKMLQAFYKGCGNNYLHNFLDYHKIDTMTLAVLLKKKGYINVPNVKLGTLTQYYNIPLDAHNAQNDIRATKKLWDEMESRITYHP